MSNAANNGSTLTSPAEEVSQSGFADHAEKSQDADQATTTAGSSKREAATTSDDNESSQRVYVLRCTILEKMIDKLDKLDNVGGVQAIPFMQIIHLLTMDLNGNSELGQRVMNKLLTVFIKKLEMVSSTPASEVTLLTIGLEEGVTNSIFQSILFSRCATRRRRRKSSG